MIITSRFLKKPIVIEKINLLAVAPATLAPPTPTINLEPLQNLGEIGQKSLNFFGTIWDYMCNPTLILLDLWNGIHTISYPILLAVSIFSIIMYFSGHKNFGKYITSSIIIFTLIQAIGRF